MKIWIQFFDMEQNRDSKLCKKLSFRHFRINGNRRISSQKKFSFMENQAMYENKKIVFHFFINVNIN